MRVEFTAAARRNMNGAPLAIVDTVARLAAGDLASTPYRVRKALRAPWDGHLSARPHPEWRIIYRIDGELITVVRVARRADVYRR